MVASSTYTKRYCIALICQSDVGIFLGLDGVALVVGSICLSGCPHVLAQLPQTFLKYVSLVHWILLLLVSRGTRRDSTEIRWGTSDLPSIYKVMSFCVQRHSTPFGLLFETHDIKVFYVLYCGCFVWRSLLFQYSHSLIASYFAQMGKLPLRWICSWMVFQLTRLLRYILDPHVSQLFSFCIPDLSSARF